MAYMIFLCLLTIIIYLLLCNLYFLTHEPRNGNNAQPSHEDERKSSIDNDIMGKSTFDVNAELRRIRQEKEEKERKAAIARGEMTENGEEIAQEVSPEDCEVETKKVWEQVPTEQLDDIFDEQNPDVPMAKGDPLNDVDLMFGPKRKELDADEERKVSESMYDMFNDTHILDDLCDQVPEVGREIRRMIDKYKAEMAAPKKPKDVDTGDIIRKRFSMEDRYADFLS